MVRGSTWLLLCLVASPAWSQSVYVGGVFGTNTTSLDRYETDGRPDIGSAGTALTIGARVGLALGARWGAELELSNGSEVTRNEQGQGSFGPTSVFSFGSASDRYTFTTHARQHNTTLSTAIWVVHTLTRRIDLALVGGASFDRMVRDERYDVIMLGPVSPFASVSFGPNSTHVVQHHVGVLAGFETRFAVGEHMRLIPGVRMHGVSGGWAIRPALAVGWLF